MLQTFILILLVLLILFAIYRTWHKSHTGGGCCGDHEKAVKRVKPKDRNPKHYPYVLSMQIGGMTCENCSRRVENALNALDGVMAKVDIATHRATVHTKESPDPQSLRLAVQKAGYIVQSISA